ncbi:hypothetical protein ACFX15_006526 [Malus domestica]
MLHVSLLAETDQVIHCQIQVIDTGHNFFASFVYGSNDDTLRRSLWANLCSFGYSIGDSPWISLGDFNVVRFTGEIDGGLNIRSNAVIEFGECLLDVGLDDLRYYGQLLTWCNRQFNGMVIHRKLDGVLVNSAWLSLYPCSSAMFLPPGASDHCPGVVFVGTSQTHRKSPFKFFNFYADHENFLHIVAHAFNTPIQGCHQFQVAKKLKLLKVELKRLNCDPSHHASFAVKNAKISLDNCQENLASTPTNLSLVDLEQSLLKNYSDCLVREESFVKQKSHVHWMACGDRNTAFFYNSIKKRANRNRIASICRSDGSVTSVLLIKSKLSFLTLLVMLSLPLLVDGVLGIIFCLYRSFFEVII